MSDNYVDDLMGNAATAGDNSTPLTEATREKLRQTVAKIERLEEEKKEVAEQIKEVYAEAKAYGFDTKALRKAVRVKQIDPQEREEQDMILDTYLQVLGVL